MTWVAVPLKEIMEIAFDMDGLFMSFLLEAGILGNPMWCLHRHHFLQDQDIHHLSKYIDNHPSWLKTFHDLDHSDPKVCM